MLPGWRVERGTVDDAELVVSELATNAFVHGGAQEVELVLVDAGPVVRVEVSHVETRPPVDPLAPRMVPAEATHGRGLAIVDVLATGWGVVEDGARRTVWADVPATRTDLLGGLDREQARARLDRDLAGAGDVQSVGVALAAWGHDVLGAAFTSIALPDRDPGYLRYLSVSALPERSAVAWSRFPVATEAPVTATYRQGRPHFHESTSATLAAFPGLGPALAAAQMSARAHLPLRAGGRVFGTLSLAWTHGHPLEADDRAWLARIADDTAAALTRVGMPGAEGT